MAFQRKNDLAPIPREKPKKKNTSVEITTDVETLISDFEERYQIQDEEEEIEETKGGESKTVDSEHMTENGNLEDYLKSAEKENLIASTEKDVEIETLTSKIKTLEEEKKDLTEKMTVLISANEKLKKTGSNAIDVKSYEDRISKLNNENDSLILKNSELEFELAKTKTLLKDALDKLDKFNHVNTKNGYVSIPRRGGYGNFRNSQNGYQDWR